MQKEKEDRPIFRKAMVIISAILIANIAFFVFKNKQNFSGFSGYAISEGIGKTVSSLSSLSKIIFIAQWGIILVILLFIIIRDVKLARRNNEVEHIQLKKTPNKFSSTDLDNLYSILQEKKKLRLSTISKAFNIDEDTALDWCKILESGNLASIDSSGVGEPILKAK